MPDFDPNSAAEAGDGVFGLPFAEKDAALVYLPVPWEATTSYGGGTSRGPRAILEASAQVDLFDYEVLKPYEPGLFMLPEPKEVLAWNRQAKPLAQRVIKAGGRVRGKKPLEKALRRVNDLGERLNGWVYAQTKRLLSAGKLVGVVGGDHSVPYGAFKALGESRPFGVLHFDAHHDTRRAYEGFEWSHASIFHNALRDLPAITRVVQVGIRDFCEEEVEFCRSQGERVRVFYDGDLARRRFSGEPFDGAASEIAAALPQEVWISFDIDGLDPRFCPHTGTPVPGGLDFREAVRIVELVVRSGRKILGFDLNEVSPDPAGKSEWDANVGARLLYKLSAWTLASQGLAQIR